MYWFGRMLNFDEKVLEEDSFWSEISVLKKNLIQTDIDQIISVLDGFSKLWNPEGELFQKALAELKKESGFSVLELHKTLGLLPSLLSRKSLEKRLAAEFKPIEQLDRFTKTAGFSGQVRAMPIGTLLHVTAGNVFLSSIDSLVMGLLTKNISILKVSSQNTFFPLFFAQSFLKYDTHKILCNKFAVLHWKGGDKSVENKIKNKVNGIIAWGGEEMIESYRRGLPAHVKFLDFGPKVSIQVISKKALSNSELADVASQIVSDITPWDQSACASPQNLYLEEGINEEALWEAINEAFLSAGPRGEVSADEAVEILKEKYRGYYSELMENGKVLSAGEHLLHLEENKFLRPSPLHRSLIIKRFKNTEDLYRHLEPFSYYLQSCGYLLTPQEKSEFLETLALAGISRFAPLGTMTWGMEGAPHDGRLVMRELVQFIGDEIRIVDYGQKNLPLTDSSYLKQHFNHSTHPKGYIFSSGGTTGEPKFVHFSYEEFDHITDMLAHNFMEQGLKSGMTVANLFVAGNLWSSFMAVEKALEKIGAIQLPIGGLCSEENVLSYLQKFKPQVVMGIPSLLVKLAENTNVSLSIPMIFYAGEALSEARQSYLSKAWGTTYFGSAGYASVDAGMIAYQCIHSQPGEHHLFSDLVQLKIVEGEAVVTSLYRTTMPIQNYRTGDKVRWIGECKCGSSNPRFKLLGRVDNLIQIWSCRINLSDIEASLKLIAPQINTYQVILDEQVGGDGLQERMRLLVEGNKIDAGKLIQKIYELSRDLKDTIAFDQFSSLVSVEGVKEISRNSRTGKISLILDQRR